MLKMARQYDREVTDLTLTDADRDWISRREETARRVDRLTGPGGRKLKIPRTSRPWWGQAREQLNALHRAADAPAGWRLERLKRIVPVRGSWGWLTGEGRPAGPRPAPCGGATVARTVFRLSERD